jgi:hypothetical protein
MFLIGVSLRGSQGCCDILKWNAAIVEKWNNKNYMFHSPILSVHRSTLSRNFHSLVLYIYYGQYGLKTEINLKYIDVHLFSVFIVLIGIEFRLGAEKQCYCRANVTRGVKAPLRSVHKFCGEAHNFNSTNSIYISMLFLWRHKFEKLWK